MGGEDERRAIDAPDGRLDWRVVVGSLHDTAGVGWRRVGISWQHGRSEHVSVIDAA